MDNEPLFLGEKRKSLKKYVDNLETDKEKSKDGVFNKIKRGIFRNLIYIAYVLGAVVLFKGVLELAFVPTGSMESTIAPNDYYIAARIIDKDTLKRGDIITFVKDGTKLVKRIIGTPGDEIKFTGGNVYVNGTLITESYLAEGTVTTCGKDFTVPDDSYFVMGDNREYSYDSRYWAYPYVDKDSISSKYLFTIPLHEAVAFAEELGK